MLIPLNASNEPRVQMAVVEVNEIKKEPETLFEKVTLLEGTYGGQCLAFIQRLFESYYTHPEFRGMARNIEPNSIEPKVNNVVLTDESKKGHAALIIAIEGDELILAESNYAKDEIIHVGRRLNIQDEHIVGYFNF